MLWSLVSQDTILSSLVGREVGGVNDEMHISEGPHLEVEEKQALVPTALPEGSREKW